MASGTVKWFDPNRGYGFIQPEQGEDVFVHVTALEGSGMESLQEGQTVEFDIEQGQKGLQAANVRSPRADQDTQSRGAVDGCDRGLCPPAFIGMVGADSRLTIPANPHDL